MQDNHGTGADFKRRGGMGRNANRKRRQTGSEGRKLLWRREPEAVGTFSDYI